MALYCLGRLSVSVATPAFLSHSTSGSADCLTLACIPVSPALRVDRGCGLGALAQHEFLDFTRRGLGQLAEHDGARQLEAREVAAAELEELGFGDCGAGLELHEGAGRFAPLPVGPRDHR